jgi:hypothetical protein
MNKLVRVLVLGSALALGVGCSSKRIKECDALVATAEKLEKCDKLDAKSRAEIAGATKTIRGALKMLDDVGGADQAPADQVDQLRKTCQQQNDSIVSLYEKVAPECLK